eukprot:5741736-Pleurochrysis_carterae.AAC.1
MCIICMKEEQSAKRGRDVAASIPMAEPIAEAVNLADGDVSLGGGTPVAKADNKSGLPQWNSIEDSIPSGKNKEELIDELKKSLYDEDQKCKKALAGAQSQKAPRSAKKRKVEDTSDALSPNLDEFKSRNAFVASATNTKCLQNVFAAEGAAAAKAATEAKLRLEEAVQAEKHQKLRDAYDGGVVFLAWLRLGPWSAKLEPAFALSDETSTPLPVPGGHNAQREGQDSYEIEKKAAAAAQDKAYEEGKLDALQLMGEAHKKSAEVRADMAKDSAAQPWYVLSPPLPRLPARKGVCLLVDESIDRHKCWFLLAEYREESHLGFARQVGGAPRVETCTSGLHQGTAFPTASYDHGRGDQHTHCLIRLAACSKQL